MPGATVVAQIEQFGNSQFGIRKTVNINPLDLVKVLCNLAASIVQAEQNKVQVATELPPDTPPPPGDENPIANP